MLAKKNDYFTRRVKVIIFDNILSTNIHVEMDFFKEYSK
jgi:hypothetical protein